MRKKLLCAVLLAMSVAIAGCGTGGSLSVGDMDTPTLLVNADGSLQAGFVESFDKEYYNEEDLEAFSNEQIEVYNEAEGKEIELEKIRCKDGEAKMIMNFPDAETYNDFLGANIVVSNLADALKAGDIPLPETVRSTQDEEISLEDIDKPENYTLVCVSEKMHVKVDGKVKYYVGGAYIKENEMESTPKAGEYSVIIFK